MNNGQNVSMVTISSDSCFFCINNASLRNLSIKTLQVKDVTTYTDNTNNNNNDSDNNSNNNNY